MLDGLLNKVSDKAPKVLVRILQTLLPRGVFPDVQKLWMNRRPVPCWEDGNQDSIASRPKCRVPERYPRVRTFRACPWRSGAEGKALCLLATPPDRYGYEELAGALGTTYIPKEGTRTAEEVGILFGIGKQRALSIEKGAIMKIRQAIADRDGLPPDMRKTASWLWEALPDDLAPIEETKKKIEVRMRAEAEALLEEV